MKKNEKEWKNCKVTYMDVLGGFMLRRGSRRQGWLACHSQSVSFAVGRRAGMSRFWFPSPFPFQSTSTSSPIRAIHGFGSAPPREWRCDGGCDPPQTHDATSDHLSWFRCQVWAGEMGAYRYIQELYRKKQSDVLRYLLRIRVWQYRQLTRMHRAPRPSRPDKARRLGYRAKQGTSETPLPFPPPT